MAETVEDSIGALKLTTQVIGVFGGLSVADYCGGFI
jgi:hypothetical protein